MITSVLIPADLSEESDFVLRFAAGLRALGVRRTVLGHSVEASGLEGPVIVAAMDRAREWMRDAAARLEGAGVQVEVRVVTGEPVDAMIALASEAHVDAIVAGSHGKTALDRLISGSMSEDLLAFADRPILFCRFDLLEAAPEPGDLARDFGRSIVLPTDFSESATRAFELVADLPKGVVGTLRLLHVLDPDSAGREPDEAEEEARRRLAELVAAGEARGLVVQSVVRRGEPGPEALSELAESGASGVITGSRGLGPWTEAVVGSVSLMLLRQAPCPVLVVP